MTTLAGSFKLVGVALRATGDAEVRDSRERMVRYTIFRKEEAIVRYY